MRFKKVLDQLAFYFAPKSFFTGGMELVDNKKIEMLKKIVKNHFDESQAEVFESCTYYMEQLCEQKCRDCSKCMVERFDKLDSGLKDLTKSMDQKMETLSGSINEIKAEIGLNGIK